MVKLWTKRPSSAPRPSWGLPSTGRCPQQLNTLEKGVTQPTCAANSIHSQPPSCKLGTFHTLALSLDGTTADASFLSSLATGGSLGLVGSTLHVLGQGAVAAGGSQSDGKWGSEGADTCAIKTSLLLSRMSSPCKCHPTGFKVRAVPKQNIRLLRVYNCQ